MSHYQQDDVITNLSDNEHFQEVVERSLANPARRNVLRGGVGLAAASTLPLLASCGGGGDAVAAAPAGGAAPLQQASALTFNAVAKSIADDVMLPPGYTYQVLHATGDRINTSVPAYSNLGTETDDWSMRIGDHHDGMDIFFIDAAGRATREDTGRAVLAVNHESSADAHFFHPRGQTTGGVNGKKFSQFGGATGWDLRDRPVDEVLKEINHHGVSLVEIVRGTDGRWSVNLASNLNRRVNAQTLMRINGPAAHINDIRRFMVTRFDTTGVSSRGTLNNCGHGTTPWGTYLACEENWAFYFNMPKGSNPVSPREQASRARYGVARAPIAATAATSTSQGWFTASPGDDRFDRWDLSAAGPAADGSQDFRNEANTFGYNVEIDPLDPSSLPRKRVAMGRFAHEAAVVGIPVAGQPLAFYMGCDSRNEYVYKFVTAANWDPADFGGGLRKGDKYLDEGKLYVAKFNDTGRGEWIELTITDTRIQNYSTYVFANQADVFVNARHAATAVGATKMDRPEWGAVNPVNGDVYFTMTNNSSRNIGNTDAANPRAYAGSDGSTGSGNPNGHIIRLKEDGTRATATAFDWDIFLFGAPAAAPANLSGLSENNDFSSPDGLWFSKKTGICWIQTDDGAFTDSTNCMLLAALPGTVGDGQAMTVNNTLGGTEAQQTFIGAALGDAKLRRFLVGPKGCEITGITETPDGKAIFVNIQHPGERTAALGMAADFTFQSTWPAGSASAGNYGPAGSLRPRSATIVIRRTDGGVIGAE